MAIQYIKDSTGRILGYVNDTGSLQHLHSGNKCNQIVATYHKNGNYTLPTSPKAGGRCNGNQLLRFLGK